MRSLTLTGAAMLTAAFLTGCGDNPSDPMVPIERPDAAVTRNDVQTGTDFASNDCTGEVFPTTYRIHTVIAGGDDAAGGGHEHVHQDIEFAAQTAAGKLVGHQTYNFELNGKIGEEQTVIFMFTLIGQGGIPNEKSTFQLHYTLLADGTITSDIEDFHIRCQ